MVDVPLHRMFHHYSEMPYSVRTLYTATLLVLGLGYMFALIFIYGTYAGRAGDNPNWLSYDDIVAGYSGSPQGSRLEAALNGPMRAMLPREDSNAIISWLHAGAKQDTFETDIRPVIEKRCMMCHDGSNPHLPNLSGYDNFKKVTEVDTGPSVMSLVRVSHIHLFGLTFIFFIMGTMFSHAYIRPVWFKCAAIVMPFVAIVADVSSWYFTKLFHPFAAVVIFGGALMGASFAFMWVVTMYQLWFSRPPRAVLDRAWGDLPSLD